MWRLVFLLIIPLSGLCSDNIPGTNSATDTGIAGNNQDIQMQEPDDDQLRLLNVFLGNIDLNEIITAYQVKENLLLPVGALSEILSIAINSRPETGTAEGFILKEDRRFFLDTSRREVTLLGKSSLYPSGMTVIYPDDIYIEARQLEKWFPFKLDIDLFSLTIIVKPTEPLPLQLRLEREKRIEAFHSKTTSRRSFPLQKTDYRLLSYPFIDQTIGLTAINNKNSKDSLSGRYTTYASLDLLHMESAIYLAGNDQDNLDTYRITMGRKHPSEPLLGPLSATEFSFGHISAPGINMITTSHSNDPGITIDNYPLGQQRDFDTHTFEGNLLPGWEVELYHNNQLIDYQTEAIDGQYRFDNITLLFGYNFFRLVFYGPNGQEREETHKFTLNRSLTRPGEQHYRLNLVEDKKTHNIIPTLSFDIGLNKSTSAKLGLASLPLTIDDKRERHEYASAGFINFQEFMVLDLNYAWDNSGGNAMDFGIQTKISKLNIKYNHIDYNDFISQAHQASNTLASKSDIRLDTAITSKLLPRVPLTIGFDERKYTTGNISTEFTNRVSTNIKGIAVSNDYSVDRPYNQSARHTGKFEITRHRRGKSLRSAISYQRKPISQINSFTLNHDGNHLGPFRLGLGYVHYANNQNQYTVDLDKRHGDFSLNIKNTYNTSGSFSLNLQASMSFGRNPADKQWTHDSRSMASLGAATLSTFMDDNQNGIQDEEEEGLENVAFRINGARRTSPTDENGIAFLTQLTPYQSMDFNVAIETLEDPLWQPSAEGIRIIPRPGQVAHVNFPILMTGEIDGTVYLQTSDGNQYAGNVELQLVDKEGKVVNSERSAFDGFYIMSGITLGTYELRVSPSQISRLGLTPPGPISVTISAAEPFISGVDYVLVRGN